MSDQYILADDGQTPIPEPDTLRWAQWFESAKRHVADDEVGPLRVSTVFLGLNHDFGLGGDPVLWETMIFGAPGELDGYQRRYTSYAEALAGHQEAVALAREALHRGVTL